MNSLNNNRSTEYPTNAATSGENNSEAEPKDMFEFYDNMDQDDGLEIVMSKKKAVQLEIFKDQIETLQKRFEKTIFNRSFIIKFLIILCFIM